MFFEPNFRGRSYQTQREVRNLVDAGFNDMAASIRVSGGRWQVCTDKNFQGQCLVITRDTNELATNFMRQIFVDTAVLTIPQKPKKTPAVTSPWNTPDPVYLKKHPPAAQTVTPPAVTGV